MLRCAIVMGLLSLGLPTGAAAAAPPDAPPNNLHVAIAQPIGSSNAPLMPLSSSPRFVESGILVLVGSGLMGLGAAVRRGTRIR